MIDEMVKVLKEKFPNANVQNSIFGVQQLKLLLDSFKEYLVGLQENLEKGSK